MSLVVAFFFLGSHYNTNPAPDILGKCQNIKIESAKILPTKLGRSKNCVDKGLLLRQTIVLMNADFNKINQGSSSSAP